VLSAALFLSFSKNGNLGEEGTAVFGLLCTEIGGIAKVGAGLVGKPFVFVIVVVVVGVTI